MNKLKLLILVILIISLSGSAYSAADWLFASAGHRCSGSAPGVANPAAVYCMELGYEYRIVTDQDGQHGVCVFPDGSSCDAWEFLEGKCGQQYSYCALNDYQIKTLSDGRDPISLEYAVCCDSEGKEVGSVVKLSGIMEKAVKGEYSTGRVPINDPTRNPIPESALDVPPVFDWRNQHGQNWITAVKNQGGCGSCWAFASVGLSEAIRNIHRNDPTIDINLSEQYLVSDCFYEYDNQNCCGGFADDALVFMSTEGIPDEACMVYVDGSGCACDGGCANCTYKFSGNCSDATCSDRCADWDTRLEYVSSWGSLGSLNGNLIKQYIATNGPVAVYIGIGDDYGGHFEGNIYRCTDDYGSNHAVLIVGYNDYEGYWIVKNSWGTTWPNIQSGGYYLVGYGECSIGVGAYYATDFTLVDTDEDGIGDACDNCPDDANSEQIDTDDDGFGDVCDNCPLVPNPNQQNSDTDEFGDACDNCPYVESPCCDDYDGDEIGDLCDNCPYHYNPWQEDYDGDDIGDVCDYLCGDFDGDQYINILDIVYLINYLYKNGPAPNPLEKMDVNHDGNLNILDIVFIINFVYKNGPEPVCFVIE